MSISKYKKSVISLTVIIVIAIAVALFFLVGPPQLLATSGTPDFCAKCHVMEAEYEAWIHAGAHRRKQCVDCHLPNENAAAHYVWKAISGLKDSVVFYSGRVPETITITAHGEDVLQMNCVRCHESAVMLIDTERKCWNCHRRIPHKTSGAIATL